MIERLLVVLHRIKIILLFGGIVSFLFYADHVANHTYLSENALIPAAGNAKYVTSHQNLMNLLESEQKTLPPNNISSQVSFLMKSLSSLSLLHFHWNASSLVSSSPLFSSSSSSSETAQMVIGVLQAKKGYGTESMVLVAPHSYKEGGSSSSSSSSNKQRNGDQIAFPFAVSILSSLKAANWLNKDIILLVPEIEHKDFLVSRFLKETTKPHQFGLPRTTNKTEPKKNTTNWNLYELPPLGRPRVGICFDFSPSFQRKSSSSSSSPSFVQLMMLHQGVDGLLPNLDLLNSAFRIAGKERIRAGVPDITRQDPQYKGLPSPFSPFVSYIRSAIHFVSSNFGVRLTPGPVETFIWGMVQQAVGHPSGLHSHLLQYRMDALTFSYPFSLLYQERSKIGRVVVGLIRSCNNLIETFHQSFYHYILPHAQIYVSIGQYMISLGLIGAPVIVFVVEGGYGPLLKWKSLKGSMVSTLILFLCSFGSLVLLSYLGNSEELNFIPFIPFLIFGSFTIFLPNDDGRDAVYFAKRWTAIVTASLFLSCVAIVNFSQAVVWASLISFHALLPLSLSSPLHVVVTGLFLGLLNPLSLLWGISFLFERTIEELLLSWFSDFLVHSTILIPSAILLYFPLHVSHCLAFFEFFATSQKKV